MFRCAGIWLGAFGCALLLSSCVKKTPEDEAKLAGLTTADFPQITADVFQPMDGGVALPPEAIMGRNAWNLWTGGNQHFWNHVAQDSYGLMDLVKMLDNRKYKRGERFATLGLSNQPNFHAPDQPDEYGLYLDQPNDTSNPEPAGIDPKVYGKPSGVMGFRLFPNPEFDAKAKQRWNGDRFMTDESYYNDNTLVRPYRVGVACGACHISPLPTNPPADPAEPKWENLASAIGNQYIREGKVFAANVDNKGFFYQMLQAQPPGTSDTSRIATDHINNPNAINPIFLLGERMRIQVPEHLAGGTLALPGTKEEMPVAHILKDGADSIGVPGATIRVYVNIGMFSEYWLTRHNRLVGLFPPQKPFEIPYAREHSVFWRATEERLGNIAAFFTHLQPFHLADAPGGAQYLTSDAAVMTRGGQVFAESCASCHSSQQPPNGIDAQSAEGKAWFRDKIARNEFLKDNFLSNEARIPLTQIKTNAARAFGTNARRDHIWDNFSSEDYKKLSPPEEVDFFNPFDEAQPIKFQPAKKNTGPGYYRVASLVSVWSSAPFLHNNSLGKFTGDPSVAGRIDAFNDAVEKLLWPEKRLGKDSIWRTQEECKLQLRKEYLPAALQKMADPDGYVRFGPIPKGTPINLIANLEPDLAQAIKLTAELAPSLLGADPEHAREQMMKAIPDLIAANKCPDFIEDKGHYFGTDLPDDDKRALIEFLKTL